MDEGPTKKRKGGQRQRMAAEQRDTRVPSALAEFLLSQFAWGHFSGQMVQHIAQLAMADFKRVAGEIDGLDDLVWMSKLGTSGAHSNNVHRDLMLHVDVGNKLPKPFPFTLVFKAPHGQQFQTAILPHELFSAIYHSYPGAWKESILPDTGRIPEFWQGVRSHPQLEGHPLLKRQNYQNLCIPIGIHGDGVPIVGLGKGWVKMALVFSWCSLLCLGNTLSSQFYIWSVFEKLCVSGVCDGTLSNFFKILVWSLKSLWLGVWPAEDWEGKRCTVIYSVEKEMLQYGLMVYTNLFYVMFCRGMPRFQNLEKRQGNIWQVGIMQYCGLFKEISSF